MVSKQRGARIRFVVSWEFLSNGQLEGRTLEANIGVKRVHRCEWCPETDIASKIYTYLVHDQRDWQTKSARCQAIDLN